MRYSRYQSKETEVAAEGRIRVAKRGSAAAKSEEQAEANASLSLSLSLSRHSVKDALAETRVRVQNSGQQQSKARLLFVDIWERASGADMLPLPSRTAAIAKREPLSPQPPSATVSITPMRTLHFHPQPIPHSNTPESGSGHAISRAPQSSSSMMVLTSSTTMGDSENQHCALQITQQPPQKWYKDQYGRKATFDIHVERIGRGCAACVDQRHLAVQLLYENGKTVENQSILRINSGLCLSKDNKSSIAIRIMEVSKNHQNKVFALSKDNTRMLRCCPLSGTTPVPVITDAVCVLSKKVRILSCSARRIGVCVLPVNVVPCPHQNKRPVKTECEEDQDTPVKVKKSKCEGDSPMLKPEVKEITDEAMVPMSGPAPRASENNNAHPDMDHEFTEQMAGESSWASQVVRFKAPTESVCLWANAAYNFLQRLQFQRSASASEGHDDTMDDFLSHASLTPYQCPVCQASYGSTAKHRLDCDLSLLLQQSGQFDASCPPATKEEKFSASSRISHVKNEIGQTFGSPETKSNMFTAPQTRVPSKYSIMQDLLQLSESPSSDARPAAPVFGANSVDLTAKNLDLSSWEGYSTLSRIMFSTLDMDPNPLPPHHVVAGDGINTTPVTKPSLNRPLSLASIVPALATVPPALSNIREHQTAITPSNFSKLVSNMKDMSPDTAAFLQEQDAELNGDASLLFSLSRVSLSEFLNAEAAGGSQKPESQHFATLSSLLSDSVKSSQPSEDSVAIIIGADFRHCGYPAFDASFSLLGFYFLCGAVESSNQELRFMPNFYPLPPEMLLELETSVLKWRRDGELVFNRNDDTPEATLTQLKEKVIHFVNERLLTINAAWDVNILKGGVFWAKRSLWISIASTSSTNWRAQDAAADAHPCDTRPSVHPAADQEEEVEDTSLPSSSQCQGSNYAFGNPRDNCGTHGSQDDRSMGEKDMDMVGMGLHHHGTTSSCDNTGYGNNANTDSSYGTNTTNPGAKRGSSMAKGDFLTPKAIANRMKSKGLQKLRWFCQVCQKQCRDENGFKCHTTSESHQRQMLIVASDPDKFISGYSEMFESAFLENLKRRHGTKRMRATVVYNEYIADKLHIHMNATQWTTLGTFVQYLGRTGKCTVDETEKVGTTRFGWYIQYIDRDPRTLARQEELEKKKKSDMDHEERNRAFIERQLKIAQDVTSNHEDPDALRPTKLLRTDADAKISLGFSATATAKASKDANRGGDATRSGFKQSLNVFGGDDSSEKVHSSSSSSLSNARVTHEDDSKKRKARASAVDDIMAEEERRKKQLLKKQQDEVQRQRLENWVTKGIVVKVTNKKVGGGEYYKRKGVITDVEDKFCATVELVDSGDVLKLDQDDLETVIPKEGRKVKIVNGIGRGAIAKLLSISVDDFCASVRIETGSRKGEVLGRVEYEDICKLADDSG
ncbi:Protein containing a u1-type zn-finger and implicated in RNA splicing or processing, partial [Globisporangium splendens]